jgi:ATP-dependent Clp protease protease subunit
LFFIIKYVKYKWQTIVFDINGVLMFKFILLLSLFTNLAFSKEIDILLTERNTISFNQAFTSAYVAKKQLEILSKNNMLARRDPIYIVMDTPGGSVTAGLAFIDTVKSLKRPVHTITLFAASMGYQVVQELGMRFITPSGSLMSHRGAVSGMSGQIPGELNSRLGYIMGLLDGMNHRAAKRVGMSVKDYKDAIVNELWVFGHQAVHKKHADAVANVVCDKKLVESTVKDEVVTFFGPVTLTYSKCPLISMPISFQLGREVKKEHTEKVIKLIQAKARRINLTM